jgi:hypothetical protein
MIAPMMCIVPSLDVPPRGVAIKGADNTGCGKIMALDRQVKTGCDVILVSRLEHQMASL